jgi:hypothetical protein
VAAAWVELYFSSSLDLILFSIDLKSSNELESFSIVVTHVGIQLVMIDWKKSGLRFGRSARNTSRLQEYNPYTWSLGAAHNFFII